ncbi:MAG: hypothetical protein HY976_02820 [Candidatus Kerfeldbacteria bacterium]|nr:hypothetical protein [Candidatus Kerfeldbacteria bacterium]
MRPLIIAVLHLIARRVVAKYHPLVIGVTGSYGKTSAKEAIAAALSSHYVVRKSPRSYNNEFGVPYTILGIVPGRNAGRTWWRAIRYGLRLLLTRQPYPTVLVLEIGDDRPGDVGRLLKIAKLDVGVLTGIGPTHLAHYRTVDNVFEEESKLITTLGPHAWAVLNGDDSRVRGLAELAMCRIVSYGHSEFVAVRGVDSAPAKNEHGEWGMVMKLQLQSQVIPLFIPGVIGRQAASAALAGAAVATAMKLDLLEVADGLRSYDPPPGRMRLLPGQRGSMLIDDTYNSSPDACVAAIESLRLFPAAGKRYAVLGEMAELGTTSESAHRGLAQTLIDNQVDVFVAVGKSMHLTADEVRKLGRPTDAIHEFRDPRSAAEWLLTQLQPGDTVLVKGSQVSRMEKAVKILMREPQQAASRLVRQDRKWLAT